MLLTHLRKPIFCIGVIYALSSPCVAWIMASIWSLVAAHAGKRVAASHAPVESGRKGDNSSEVGKLQVDDAVPSALKSLSQDLRVRSPTPEHIKACTLAGFTARSCPTQRCAWILHRSAYLKRLPFLQEQPDKTKPFGLGCRVCAAAIEKFPEEMRASRWSRFKYMMRMVHLVLPLFFDSACSASFYAVPYVAGRQQARQVHRHD